MSLFTSSLLALAFVAAPALANAQDASPVPSASPAAAATMDPGKVRELALQVLGEMQNGKIDRSIFTDQMNAQLTDDQVRALAPQLTAIGQPQASLLGIKTYPGITEYTFLLRSSAGNYDEVMALDADGKIAGINFVQDTTHG